jgi:2-keto-3-deoxy-L-rhamnonate aldolase RhmA
MLLYHVVSQLILACQSASVSPIVRVPSKSHWHISKAFDAGAACVVVLHIESVEEVRGLVQAGKFRPSAPAAAPTPSPSSTSRQNHHKGVLK